MWFAAKCWSLFTSNTHRVFCNCVYTHLFRVFSSCLDGTVPVLDTATMLDGDPVGEAEEGATQGSQEHCQEAQGEGRAGSTEIPEDSRTTLRHLQKHSRA